MVFSLSMNNTYELILATDLDGTFLEGDSSIKELIYNKLLNLRDRILLIYVTGRSIDAVERFCKHGYLPNPHFVIADHGTHIVDGINFAPIEHLQNPIIKKWNNSNNRLKQLLQYETALQLQPIDPPYRVAYYYDPDTLQEKTLEKISTAGFDAILSCEMYLDIVPQGVNKGSSLLNLLNSLQLNHDNVITCGDSLNDLSLFETGLKSIAVGNSEIKLVAAIKNLANVYHSSFSGLQGIVDGLHFYKKNAILSG